MLAPKRLQLEKRDWLLFVNKAQEKKQRAEELAKSLANWDPKQNSDKATDPYLTLFIGNLVTIIDRHIVQQKTTSKRPWSRLVQ